MILGNDGLDYVFNGADDRFLIAVYLKEKAGKWIGRVDVLQKFWVADISGARDGTVAGAMVFTDKNNVGVQFHQGLQPLLIIKFALQGRFRGILRPLRLRELIEAKTVRIKNEMLLLPIALRERLKRNQK